MSEKTLQIQGLHCAGCVARVERALSRLPGVKDVAVNLATGLANVTLEQEHFPVEVLQQTVVELGYQAKVVVISEETLAEVASQSHEQVARQKRQWLWALATGLPAWVLGMTWGDGYLTWALASLTLVMGGGPFFLRGSRALWRRAPDMDSLVAVGAGTAYLYSSAILLGRLAGFRWEHAHLELHAAVTIVLLVALGRYLEAKAKQRAGSAVAELALGATHHATLVEADGTTRQIGVDQIRPGVSLQILAHQQAPVDGRVTGGSGSLNQALVTGESVPMELSVGDAVPGGAILIDGRIVMEATSTARTSTVARIVGLVHQAQASKTQIQGLADRVAGIFVPVILVLALLTLLGWGLFSGDWAMAMMRAIATVVISCPCAMGLATPTALTVAMGRGAKMGLLFTHATALETAQRIETVLFDKTGTLTRGSLEVLEIDALGDIPHADPESWVLGATAALEQFSDHPLAQAILTRSRHERLPLVTPSHFSSTPGQGVQGYLNGKLYRVGSERWMRSLGLVGPEVEERIAALHQAGMTLVMLADEKALLGFLSLRDHLHHEAREAVATLRQAGIRVGVISGDSEAAVRGALRGIEFDVWLCGVSPEGKAQRVLDFQGSLSPRHPVAFVGDGSNDAPALAAADLGIVMPRGTDLAKEAGDVVLVSNRLLAVPQALALAQATLRVIRQNLLWAFGYNVAAIPLAVFGVLSPGLAAGAMMLSSLSVVLNALRLNHMSLTLATLPKKG